MSARMPTTIPTMTIPMRIGRRLDSCRSVVGFMFGWSRPSMAGLYYRRLLINAGEGELPGSRAGRRCGFSRFPRIGHTVVVIFNRERGAAAEADVTYGLVAPGKPEILHLHVFVMNFTFLRPSLS